MRNLLLLVLLLITTYGCGGAVDGVANATSNSAAGEDTVVVFGDLFVISGTWEGAVALGYNALPVNGLEVNMDELFSWEPNKVYLLMGHYDLVEIGATSADALIPYKSIINKLANEGIATVVLSTPYVAKSSYEATAINRNVKELNDGLIVACTGLCSYVDLNEAIAYDDYLEEGYATSDGRYLTSAGYETLAGLFNKLEE